MTKPNITEFGDEGVEPAGTDYLGELRKALAESNTFNYNVYGGVAAYKKSLTFDRALDEIINIFTAHLQTQVERAEKAARIEAGTWGVKYAIAEFCKMNIENPSAPVNVDEVKRRAIIAVQKREWA